MIRWPINFPPSSKAAILREARVGRITCQRVQVNSSWMRKNWPPPLPRSTAQSLQVTFLKTIGSSSHRGLMALLFWEVLVFSAFLLVSAGSPNISTSMYTPTRRSVRNWPEITLKKHRYNRFHMQSGSTETKHWLINNVYDIWQKNLVKGLPLSSRFNKTTIPSFPHEWIQVFLRWSLLTFIKGSYSVYSFPSI